VIEAAFVVHTDTDTNTNTRIQVPVNTSLQLCMYFNGRTFKARKGRKRRGRGEKEGEWKERWEQVGREKRGKTERTGRKAGSSRAKLGLGKHSCWPLWGEIFFKVLMAHSGEEPTLYSCATVEPIKRRRARGNLPLPSYPPSQRA